jgi:hypothetical protein
MKNSQFSSIMIAIVTVTLAVTVTVTLAVSVTVTLAVTVTVTLAVTVTVVSSPWGSQQLSKALKSIENLLWNTSADVIKQAVMVTDMSQHPQVTDMSQCPQGH